MKRVASFGRLFLRRPTAAAEACERPQALADGLWVYAAWLALSLLYLRLKPFNFPDVNAAPPLRPEGTLFWLRTALWEPWLAAVEIALTGVLLDWMSGGWLPLKTAAATLWAAVLPAATLAYARGALPGTRLAAVLVLWAVPGAALARRIPAARWRRLSAFLLGLNAVGIVMLIPEAASALLHSQWLFNAALGGGVLWLLVCGGLGLRRLAGVSAARAVLAFLFANLALNAVIAAAFLLHLLPLDVLKALVYV